VIVMDTNVDHLVRMIAEIYARYGKDAEDYLSRARSIISYLGSGTAVIYCWFFSVPQKWTQIEPKIFDLMKQTNMFNLNDISRITYTDIAFILRPMVFYNQIALQFLNFCSAIKKEYFSWDNFAKELKNREIFDIFTKLKKYRNIRLTFKNLAAMKIFVGNEDNMIIFDTHISKFMNINDAKKRRIIKLNADAFRHLLYFSNMITNRLRNLGFRNITLAKWSLAVWFSRSNTRSQDLLNILKK